MELWIYGVCDWIVKHELFVMVYGLENYILGMLCLNHIFIYGMLEGMIN